MLLTPLFYVCVGVSKSMFGILERRNDTNHEEHHMPSVRRTPNGTRVVRAANDNSIPEWKIQAEAVRRLRQLPGYGDEAAPGVTFTLAGDFNAARRSRQESVK